MVRQQYYHDPSRKHLEVYQDFSGGLNTESSNDNMSNKELKMLKNIDLGDRGSLVRRRGLKSIPNVGIEDGFVQGIFKHYRNYTPYNLLGIEGSFSGNLSQQTDKTFIGSWRSDKVSPDQVYKLNKDEPANLIVEPEFDNGGAGWILDNYDSDIVTVDGDTCLRMIIPPNDAEVYHNEYTAKTYDVKEGDEFYMEAYFKAIPLSIMDKNPLRSQLAVMYLDENENPIRPSGFTKGFGFDYEVEDGNGWRKASGYTKIPEGVAKVRFGVGVVDGARYDGQSCGVYVDTVFLRRQIAGVEDSTAVIQASASDSTPYRTLKIPVKSFENYKRYVCVVEVKQSGGAEGRVVIKSNYETTTVAVENIDGLVADTWTPIAFRFTTTGDMSNSHVFVQNTSPAGTSNTIQFYRIRIYELKNEDYDNILQMTPGEIAEAFPYRTGKLTSESIEETVIAAGGTIYIDGVPKEVEGGYPIQSERIIEAVNYRNNLYIASGSGLLVYNGSTLAKVTPHRPSPLERLYVGSNALEDTPFEVQDEEGVTISVKDIQFSSRYGVINEFIDIVVSAVRPSATPLEYKFERKRVNDKVDEWFIIQDWAQDQDCIFVTDIAGEYQFRISVREVGSEVEADVYKVPKYIVKSTADDNDIPIDANTIDMCNRITVHWDRLIMYGDQSKRDVIYISHLYQPNYFPVNNTLQFENPRKERITNITHFRDNLVVFTPSSIQALYGKSPQDYRRVSLNTTYGCIADRGAQVVKNYVVFPSYEGIALLKSVGTSEIRHNVDLIDGKIKSLVYNDENAFSYLRNNQYCLVYPDRKRQLRYYYEWGTWSMDESASLDIVDGLVENGVLLSVGTDGRIITDGDDYTDEGVPFEAYLETKFFDFGNPYAIKKTKELQVMTPQFINSTTANVTVVLDTDVVGNEDINILNGEEVYKLMIAGKGLSVSVRLTHEENKEFKLLGLGFITKLKKP